MEKVGSAKTVTSAGGAEALREPKSFQEMMASRA